MARGTAIGATSTTTTHTLTPPASPFGFWTIRALNLSLCAVPKAGSTMNRQLVARAAGLLLADEVKDKDRCWYGWSDEDNARLRARGVTQDYDPHTVTIGIVRDPWDRAVSAFVDQIARGHLPRNDTSVQAFLAYLDRPLRDGHHTGAAARRCLGLPGARFDHLVDLGSPSNFARVSRLVPAYAQLIERGWERCTGGDPRLYMPGSVSPHRNRDTDLPRRLCRKDTLAKVCAVYAEDYALYTRLGYPYECACSAKEVMPIPLTF